MNLTHVTRRTVRGCSAPFPIPPRPSVSDLRLAHWRAARRTIATQTCSRTPNIPPPPCRHYFRLALLCSPAAEAPCSCKPKLCPRSFAFCTEAAPSALFCRPAAPWFHRCTSALWARKVSVHHKIRSRFSAQLSALSSGNQRATRSSAQLVRLIAVHIALGRVRDSLLSAVRRGPRSPSFASPPSASLQTTAPVPTLRAGIDVVSLRVDASGQECTCSTCTPILSMHVHDFVLSACSAAPPRGSRITLQGAVDRGRLGFGSRVLHLDGLLLARLFSLSTWTFSGGLRCAMVYQIVLCIRDVLRNVL
ncbi:hypothetical protein FB451DRAFT_1241501, partial [Mycena latifolia]